jgi:two-component system response regulator FixJ
MNSIVMVLKSKMEANDNAAGNEKPAPVTAAPFEFAGKELLTPRESEVLALIANGVSNKEAGRRLGISPRTIKTHRAHIMVKIGARNASDLVRIVLGGGAREPKIAPHLVA